MVQTMDMYLVSNEELSDSAELCFTYLVLLMVDLIVSLKDYYWDPERV